MMEIRDKPILTETFDSLEDFIPLGGAAYIFGTSVEDRSAHSPGWSLSLGEVSFVRILEQRSTDCDFEVEGRQGQLLLRSSRALGAFWGQVGCKVIYLDITGLSHHVWAPLVKSAIENNIVLRVVYVEPIEYRFSSSPTEGEIFDLSERIVGISPLPGFTTLVSKADDFIFVPLVGFEGARLAYVLEQVQPLGERIVPVVGVPGFHAEYPFHAYIGNRLPFVGTKCWRSVYFARANCPFSLFYALLAIASRGSVVEMKVAPIGTKPHSLGAILFYLAGVCPIELVYDHPVRKKDRTEGASRASVYHVTSFVQHFQASRESRG
jgi:hypothetical protein